MYQIRKINVVTQFENGGRPDPCAEKGVLGGLRSRARGYGERGQDTVLFFHVLRGELYVLLYSK